MTIYHKTSDCANNFVVKFEDGTTLSCSHTLKDAERIAEQETNRIKKTTYVYEYIGYYNKED